MQTILRRLTSLMLAGMLMMGLAACGGTVTARGTASGTTLDGNGRPMQTQQSIDVTVTRTGGIGAPSADSVMGNMLGTGAGYSQGSGYYGPNGVWYPNYYTRSGYTTLPGTSYLPDGTAVCANPIVRASGQKDCTVFASDQPAPPSYYSGGGWAGGGGYYGTGQYYYNPRTGTQQQDIRPGFKT